MYDKTEDFIGGGTKPPTIHDPGAFEALEANPVASRRERSRSSAPE
jgi:hypothetical protein